MSYLVRLFEYLSAKFCRSSFSPNIEVKFVLSSDERREANEWSTCSVVADSFSTVTPVLFLISF